jgi:hypothetical protein
MSLLISHFDNEYAALYRNNGDLTFTDISIAAGIAKGTRGYVGWGDAFVDFDNDGWEDFFLVNGHVYPQVDSLHSRLKYFEPKLLFLNQRDGTFADISKLAGAAIQVPQVSRGPAVGDLFNDGKLEAVVENLLVVEIIPAQFPGKIRQFRIRVDQQVFHASHGGEVFQVFRGQGRTEGSVMRAACQDPGRGGDLQVGLGHPDGPRHRQRGKRVLGRHERHWIDDHPEAVRQLYNRGIHRLPGGCGKHQPDGVLFPPNRQGMDFDRQLAGCDRGAHFEHMRPQHLAVFSQMIGIVLHE